MWRAATDLFKAGLNTIGSAPSALTPGTVISVSGFRVEIIQKLAEGGFAFVYHVRDVSSGQSYALKRLLVNDSEDLNKVKEEISFLVCKSQTHSTALKEILLTDLDSRNIFPLIVTLLGTKLLALLIVKAVELKY